jgi:hypothetical protein
MYFLNDEDHDDLAKILARATVDPEFRQRLIAEPRDAVREATGVELPPKFRIRFVEQPSDVDALVVLPNAVSTPDELSETELEAVAGGVDETDLEAICWRTCKETCKTSCDVTCDITGVTA